MNNLQHPNRNVPQPAAAEQNNPNWRQTDLTVQERAKLVSQLCQALKYMSPSTLDTQIINVARAFERQIFSRSSSKREYLTLYSRKLSQIQRQLVIRANQQNQAGLGVTTADNNGGQSNLLGVNIQHQMQAMINSPQQQSLVRPPQQQQLQQQQQSADMQQQAQLRPQMNEAGQQQQQRPLASQQQQVMARQLLSVKSQQRQQQAMVAAASGGGQGPQQQAAQLQAKYQQTVATLQNMNQSSQLAGTLTQGQLQSLIQRQQVVAQQQKQAVAAQNASNAEPSQYSLPPPHDATTSHASATFSRRRRGILRYQLPGHDHRHSHLWGRRRHQQLQMQQQTQQQSQTQQQQQGRVTQLQAQQAQPQDLSSVGLNPQLEQQGSAARLPHEGVSQSQYDAASQAVLEMVESIEASHVKLNPIPGLSEEEKVAIGEQVQQMTEIIRRVDQLLPDFFALTNNREAMIRLIRIRYEFQDQLDALPRDEYMIRLVDLEEMKRQFLSHIHWVENQYGGQSQLLPDASLPDTNTQATTVPVASQTVLQQVMAAQQRVYELRQQQQGMSPSITSISETMALPLQRTQEPVVAGYNKTPLSGASVPVTVDLSGSPVPASVQPLQPAPSAAQIKSLFVGFSQQQAVQAAVAAGLAPQIAHALSPRALHAQHLLQQANLGKTLLNTVQKAQLQKMYSDQVVIARQVAQQQTNAKALALAAQMQRTSASGAAFTGVVATPASGATGNNQELQQTTSITAPTPMLVAVDAVEQNKAQIRAMTAAVEQQQRHAQQQQTTSVKTEPVFVIPDPRPGVGKDGAVFDTALYTNDVLKDFTKLLPSANVLGPSCGKGFVGEDHVFGQANPKKQSEIALIKDVIRGFEMGKDDDTDLEEDMIDMDEIDADDEHEQDPFREEPPA